MRMEPATSIEYVQPNPDILAITRLFLEKFEKLNDEERKMFAEIIHGLAHPTVIAR